MKLRDRLNTEDKYNYLIENYKLNKLEAKGVQKFSRPNIQVIKSSHKIIAGYQEEILIATYSVG